MNEIKQAFFMIFFVFVASSLIPVYAEVNSFQTDKSFYVAGDKIYFTGTVGINDYKKPITLVIHDPAGKFVLISGNYSDSIYNFEMAVNTNDASQFSTKGTYSATAFIESPSTGKTINFDFSPDGSPVIHSQPSTNETETINSDQPIPQHYKSQLKENVATNDITGNPQKELSSTSSSLGKSSIQYMPVNILYLIISLSGVGIVITVLYMKKRNLKSEVQRHEKTVQTITNDEKNDDYAIMVLKNRLAKGEINLDEFNAIKNVLAEP